MYWVTMTDRFMSGWREARDKTNKLVIECETFSEAKVVKDNADNRSEMKYVNIRCTKPYYGRGYHVSLHDKNDYESWFVPGYF